MSRELILLVDDEPSIIQLSRLYLAASPKTITFDIS
jgi:hypothetical protein